LLFHYYKAHVAFSVNVFVHKEKVNVDGFRRSQKADEE
jgi:hypothetical protein